MLIKFALSEGSTAAIGVLPPAMPSTRKTAHKVTFDYEPKPGYIYVRSRAISSRCNDNFDEFPAEEIKKAYRTFIGKPVFVNHHNANHKRARGVIVDAALHEDVNPDGTPDTWTEVLMEVDAVRFPMLAKACLPGPNGEPPQIERTSMGTDVEYSVCSFCGNKAYTPVDYCNHIPRLKGQRIRRRTASGTTEDVLVREICYGLGFFENSLLVEPPADPTAYTLGVDDRGLQMAASTSSRSRVAGRRHSHRSQRRVPDPTLGPITASKTAERVPVRSIEVGDQVKRATGEVVEVLRPPEEPPATERGPLENIGARFWGRYQGREGWMSYGSMDTEVERVHKYAHRTARDDRQWTQEDEAKINRANDGKFAPKGTDDGPKAELGGERDREEAPKKDKAQATDASQVEPYVPSKPPTGSGTKDDPIVTDDVEAAVKALVENKHVNLSQPKVVTTVLGGVREQVMAAIESGESLTVDLCNVTVKGTNLFCTESKGIPRIKMPQLTAKTVRPGSRAEQEAKRTDGKDGFNIMPQFRAMLEERGLTVTDTKEKAAYLKATQSELNAGKVSSMLGRLEEGGSLGDESLFVSNDNYILDGHHRWAAQVAHDGADNVLGNEYEMSIQRIDLDIISLYHEAMTFADEWGIDTAGVGDVGKVAKDDCGCGSATAEKKDPRFEGVSLKEDDDGWYVHTHRARSDSYPTPEDIPQSKVDFIESTGAQTPYVKPLYDAGRKDAIADRPQRPFATEDYYEGYAAGLLQRIMDMELMTNTAKTAGAIEGLEKDLVRSFEGRDVPDTGDTVTVYRDLSGAPKSGYPAKQSWSIKTQKSGLVVGHTQGLRITNVQPTFLEGARKQFQRTVKRGVHAFLTGTVDDYTTSSSGRDVTYFPDISVFFMKDTRREFLGASAVTFAYDRCIAEGVQEGEGPMPRSRFELCWDCGARPGQACEHDAMTVWGLTGSKHAAQKVFVRDLKEGEEINFLPFGKITITKIEDAGVVNIQGETGKRIYSDAFPGGLTFADTDSLSAVKPMGREDAYVPTPEDPNASRTGPCPECDKPVRTRGQDGKIPKHNWGNSQTICDASGKTHEQAYEDVREKRREWDRSMRRNYSLDEFTGREAARLLANLEKGTPEYKKAYIRGWNASERGSEGALERADSRGEPNAWYDGYMDSATGRDKYTLMYFDSAEEWYAASDDDPRLQRLGMRVEAYGEQVAPPKVDTLREEECPVCGETEAYDGGECRVCGFIRPPDDFMDPDLEKAREVDLRQDEAKADAEGDPEDGQENNQATDDPQGPLKIVKYTPSSKEGKTSRSQPASGSGSGTTGGTTMDPTLKVLRAQQRTIEAQAARIQALEKRQAASVGLMKMIAKAAGIDGQERVATLIREADIDNPAQPVADKPAEAPAVTTEEAKTPAATTDVQSDQAVLTDVSPDAQTSLGSDETVLDQPLDLNEQDVEAPVSGLTQPGEDMKIETDVRGPDTPSTDTMDPWHLSSKQEQEARPIAAMRLARLRIQAGIADTDDDLDLSSRIAQDASLSAEAIASETATLTQVVERQQGNGQRTASRGLVPQRAADVPRLTPSFSPQTTDRPLQTVGSVSADEIAFE